MDRLIASTQLLAVLLVGVAAGTFVATQIGQVRVQRTLGARDFTLVKHSFEVAVGGIMPVLVIAAAVSILPVVALSAVSGRRAILVLPIVALALWVAVIVVTLVYNAPVNSAAATWDPSSPPADWQAMRDKWHFGQTVRTPPAVASFICLAVSAVWPRLTS
jgi:uncharacterized membrane protein